MIESPNLHGITTQDFGLDIGDTHYVMNQMEFCLKDVVKQIRLANQLKARIERLERKVTKRDAKLLLLENEREAWQKFGANVDERYLEKTSNLSDTWWSHVDSATSSVCDESQSSMSDALGQITYYPLLDQKQCQLIETNQLLDDSIMDLAQQLVDSQQHSIHQSTLLKYINFSSVDQDHHIQLLNSGCDHWVTVQLKENQVYVADSLVNGLISPMLIDQLKQLYPNAIDEDGEPVICYFFAQQQSNGWDCGVFAIANAFELISGGKLHQAEYETSKMRDHLIYCLSTGTLVPFQKSTERNV